MKEKILIYATIMILTATVTFAKTIAPEQAKSFIGEYVNVEYVVGSAYNSGKACFLNSAENYRDNNNFVVVIFGRNFNLFHKSPENYYLKKRVVVSGIVKEHNGKAEIIVNSPGDIKIAEITKGVAMVQDREEGLAKSIILHPDNTWEWQ